MLNVLNRLRLTKDVIKKAQQYRKKREGNPPQLIVKFPDVKFRGGSAYVNGYQVVPREDREKVLKKYVYARDSTTPFGRDTLFAWLKEKKIAGVSRRFIAEYLRGQDILQLSRSKPRRVVRQNVSTFRNPRWFACDLVHVRPRDVGPDFLGEPADGQNESADRYLLTCVNLLTSYTYIRFCKRKLATDVVVQMRSIIKDIQKRFKRTRGITNMSSDNGSEFKSVVKKLFDQHKIEHRVVKLSAAIENRNAYIQQVMYRLHRMKRGGGRIQSILKQTQAIVNNTEHTRLKQSPNQAVAQLAKGEKVKRKDYKPVVKMPTRPPKNALPIGTKVRKIKGGREKPTPFYKRYHQGHISKTIYTIKKVRMVKQYPKYIMEDGSTAWHDEVIRSRTPDRSVSLPLIKTPVKKKEVKTPTAPTRRSSRQRGKRVDYKKYY